MTSLNYDKIFSRLFSKIEAYDFLDLTTEQVNEFLCDWLHSSLAKPYVRRLFISAKLDDEIRELKYEMKYSIDEDTDMEFVIEILTLGAMIEWLTPKIFSITSISQTFASKEEKFYSESQHLKQLQDLKKSCETNQRRIIADRGYAWNKYLDGE